MIKCAKQGLGLIQLPIYMVEDLFNQRKLIAVLQEYQRTEEHVYYHYPKYRYVQPKSLLIFFLCKIT
ncbi:MAG: DNA-binding transcriptional LysR family regulator [Francisellaceae bacterium]|jgi:DNA-binding transcriptional LysR family regulator